MWSPLFRLCLLSLLLWSWTGCAGSEEGHSGNDKPAMTMGDPFPFEVHDGRGEFPIVVPLEREDLFAKYQPVFERHGYTGNGYSWEGHIIQMLEKLDPDLLVHIRFDPEAGGFYAYADSKQAQIEFINVLGPVFRDMEQLENMLGSADRNRIDD